MEISESVHIDVELNVCAKGDVVDNCGQEDLHDQDGQTQNMGQYQ